MADKPEPMQHRCIVQTGNMAGNDHVEDVSSYHIEYGGDCPNCGEELAPTGKVLAFLYARLIEEPNQ